MRHSLESLNFFDHLDELRNRLIKSLLAVVAAACLFYFVIDDVLAFLIAPVGKLVFTSPGEAFVTRIALTLYGGVFFAFPVILYQVWRFVGAGMNKNEIKYVFLFGPFSIFLFLAGAVFAYFVTIPIAIRFLLSFSSDVIVPMITIRSYIAFVGTMLLAFGVVFELPLVLMFLTKIGITSPDFLRQKRKHAIVVILVVSAVMTPPDVITQMIMSVPLVVLYEVGILASMLIRSGEI